MSSPHRDTRGGAEGNVPLRRPYEKPRVEKIGTVLSLTRRSRKGNQFYIDDGFASK